MMLWKSVRSARSPLLPVSSAVVLMVLTTSSPAAAQSNKVAPSTGLLQIFAALIFVIALMLALAWLFKRVGPLAHSQQLPMKLIGGLNLGHREKVIVVEVADQWLVLGVTSQQITKLAELEKQELSTPDSSGPIQNNFADWLKKTLDKRSATTH